MPKIDRFICILKGDVQRMSDFIPRPGSSIAAQKYGYSCDCPLGRWCDGGCMMVMPATQPRECIMCHGSYIPNVSRCKCFDK